MKFELLISIFKIKTNQKITFDLYLDIEFIIDLFKKLTTKIKKLKNLF